AGGADNRFDSSIDTYHTASSHISQQEKKGQIFHSSSENINPQVQEKHSFHNGEETENLLLLQSSSFLPSPHPSSSCSVFLQQNNVSACSQEKRDLRPKTSSNFSSHGMYKETDEKEKKPPPSPSLISQSGLSHPSFIPQMSSSSSESNQDREMECIYTSKTSERKGERNDEHVKETFFPPSFSVQERNHYEVVSSSSQEMKYWRLSIDLLSIQFFAMNANHPNAPSSHARRQVYIQYNYPPFGASHLFSTQPPVDCSKQDDQQVPLTNGFCAYTLTASSQRLRHSLQSFPLTLHICSSSTSSPPSSSSSVPPPRNRAFATSPGTSAQTSHSSSCSSSPHYRSSSSFSERKNGSSGEVTSASKRGISTVSDRSRGRPSSGVGRQKGEEKEEDEEKGSSVLLGVCTLDLSVVLQQPLLRNYQAPFQYQAYSSLLPIIQAQNSKIPASEKHHNIGQVSIQVFLEHLLLLPSAPDATGEKKVLSSSSSFPSAVDSGTQSIGVSVHPSSIQSIQQEPRPHSHHLLHSISPSPPLPSSSSSFSSCGRRANEAFLLEESFKTAYELELWKRSEEVKFLAELQKRMTEEREKMLEEVKVKEDKQNQEIREKQEAIHLLQSQLKQTAQNLQQKALELQGRENELRVEKERCLEISAQTAEELAVVTRRMKEEKDHAIELEKQKSLHLQRQNEDLEEEVKRIRLRVELLEEENYDLRCQITSAPTAQLQADLKLKMYQVANLESQLSAMTASRDHFVSNCAALLEKLHAIRDQMRERSTAYIQRREEDEEETQRERKRSLRSRSHSSGLNASRKDMSCSSSPSDMIEKSSEERMKNEIDALRSDILSLKEIFMNERRLSSSSLPNQEKKEEKGKEDKISLSLHENMNSSSSSSSFHRLPLSLPVPSSSSVSTLALQHLSYPSSPPPKNLFGFTNQHVFSSSSALPSERKKVIGEDGRKEEQERERREEDNEKADHLQTRERESFLSSNEEKEKNEDKTSLLSLTPVERSLPPTPHPQNLLGVHARKEEEEKIKKSKRKDQEDDDGDREEVEIKVKMIERQLDTLLRQGIYREEDGVIRALRSRIKDLRQMNDMLLQKEHKESEK
ncbi:centrosomal protein of 120 kda, partial [Cystoisospora suis]